MSLRSCLLAVLLAILCLSTVSAGAIPLSRLQRLQRRAASSEFETEETGEFFVRSAKWVSKMNPGGGSLVSGRGGFRPGFLSRDWRSVLAEPNFVKRAYYNDY